MLGCTLLRFQVTGDASSGKGAGGAGGVRLKSVRESRGGCGSVDAR